MKRARPWVSRFPFTFHPWWLDRSRSYPKWILASRDSLGQRNLNHRSERSSPQRLIILPVFCRPITLPSNRGRQFLECFSYATRNVRISSVFRVCVLVAFSFSFSSDFVHYYLYETYSAKEIYRGFSRITRSLYLALFRTIVASRSRVCIFPYFLASTRSTFLQ